MKRTPVGMCHRGHAFDDANTYIDKRGSRHCRACARSRMSATRAARRQAPPTFEEQQWKRVRPEPGGCWLWRGRRVGPGPLRYGQIRFPDGSTIPAHRWAYESLVGPIPAGLVLDHLCRNPPCVNPDHLEPVPNVVNIMRGVGVGALNARKTHCKHGHEFTEENTLAKPLRSGNVGRQCRSCLKAANAKNSRKRTEARLAARQDIAS